MFGINAPSPTNTAGYFLDGTQTAAPMANGTVNVGLLATPDPTSYDVITTNMVSFSVAGGYMRPGATATSGFIFKVTGPTTQITLWDRASIAFTGKPIDPTKPMTINVIPTKWRALWDAGERLSPDLLARLKGFGTIRAMDAMRTNGSTVTDTRPLPGDVSYNSGLPVEVLCDIANATGEDLCLNIPHLATDALIVDMISAASKRLNPALHLLLEPSNEVWNNGFAQSKWAGVQGQARYRLPAEPAVAAVGKTKAIAAKLERPDPKALAMYYGYMAARVSKAIKAATPGTAPRAKIMLAWWFISPGDWSYIISAYKAEGGDMALIDSISSAVYPQGITEADGTKWALANDKKGDFASANAFLDNWEATRTKYFALHAAFAKSIGVAFDLYECSVAQITTEAPGFKSAANRPMVTDFFTAVTHSPEGVARFSRLMATFESVGGRTANYFNLWGLGSQYGIFGVFANMQDETGFPIASFLAEKNAAAWASRVKGWLGAVR